MTAHAHPYAYSLSFDSSKDSRRLTLAATITVVSAVVAGFGLFGAERMSISRVAAPAIQDFALFTPLHAAPPPAVKPPPKVESAAAAAAAATPQRHERQPEELMDNELNDDPPTHSSSKLPPGVGRPTAFSTGLPPGVKTATCIGPHCKRGPGIEGGTGTRGPKAPMQIERRQLACIACAAPKKDRLRSSAKPTFRGGTNVTSFCVNEKGRPEQVRTKRTSGDLGVDRSCRDAVKGWRMQPFRVGGRARQACTEASFEIEMK